MPGSYLQCDVPSAEHCTSTKSWDQTAHRCYLSTFSFSVQNPVMRAEACRPQKAIGDVFAMFTYVASVTHRFIDKGTLILRQYLLFFFPKAGDA